MTSYRQIGAPQKHGIVCIADHASNHVPAGIDLQIAPELLHNHIAIDIGTEGITEHLAARHGIPAHIAAVSRLVCDLNREEGSPGCVPRVSDGHPIPGNENASLEERMARFHRPYHAALAEWLAAAEPALIISLHSFTPCLSAKPDEARPWHVGLLYNADARAAEIALPLLTAKGFTVGDNQPYSGKLLNATMNRHAEAHGENGGRPYLTFEIRQDLIGHAAGQAEWADIIAETARKTLEKFAASS